MTRASTPETNSAKPKSPPAPSSGAPPSVSPPVSQERSPSRRAMNPSTLMPRNTEPVKGESMPHTVPQRYDDSDPHRRGGVRAREPDDGVAGAFQAVVGHADHQPIGQGRAEIGHQGRGRRGSRCAVGSSSRTTSRSA